MDSLPVKFIRSVVGFVRDDELIRVSGHFAHFASQLQEHSFQIQVILVYDQAKDTVQYQILRRDITNRDGYAGFAAYSYLRSDYNRVFDVTVSIYNEVFDTQTLWTSAKGTDPEVRRWLKAPFDYVRLVIEGGDDFDCSKLLDLVPEDYTFNEISADCKYGASLDRIIQKSSDLKRLEWLDCPQFYQNRSLREVMEFYQRNLRLTYFMWERDYGDVVLVSGNIFDIWWNHTDILTKPVILEGDELRALKHFEKFDFKRSAACNCQELQDKYMVYRDFGDCLHFELKHSFNIGKVANIILCYSSEGFQQATSLKEAVDFEPMSYFIVFPQ